MRQPVQEIDGELLYTVKPDSLNLEYATPKLGKHRIDV
jgi:hypothetical protein